MEGEDQQEEFVIDAAELDAEQSRIKKEEGVYLSVYIGYLQL